MLGIISFTTKETVSWSGSMALGATMDTLEIEFEKDKYEEILQGGSRPSKPRLKIKAPHLAWFASEVVETIYGAINFDP